MNKVLRNTLTSIISLLFLLSYPVNVYAGFCMDTEDFTCLEYIYVNILQNIMGFILIVLFILIISGGLKWVTSSGDPKDIENAQGRITFAVFGIALIFVSWLLLRFISEFTTVPAILQFVIPPP